LAFSEAVQSAASARLAEAAMIKAPTVAEASTPRRVASAFVSAMGRSFRLDEAAPEV
jgi:hypothetical protein